MWVSRKVAELDDVIATLRVDLELANRRSEIKVIEARATWLARDRDERYELALRNATLEAQCDLLQKQLADSPYGQLTDILKALVVKLPTLNIQELSVHGKEK